MIDLVQYQLGSLAELYILTDDTGETTDMSEISLLRLFRASSAGSGPE
jgi:hypothetical protein